MIVDLNKPFEYDVYRKKATMTWFDLWLSGWKSFCWVLVFAVVCVDVSIFQIQQLSKNDVKWSVSLLLLFVCFWSFECCWRRNDRMLFVERSVEWTCWCEGMFLLVNGWFLWLDIEEAMLFWRVLLKYYCLTSIDCLIGCFEWSWRCLIMWVFVGYFFIFLFPWSSSSSSARQRSSTNMIFSTTMSSDWSIVLFVCLLFCCCLLFVDSKVGKKYDDTLNLPKSSFPMRANSLKREPLLRQACTEDLYANSKGKSEKEREKKKEETRKQTRETRLEVF